MGITKPERAFKEEVGRCLFDAVTSQELGKYDPFLQTCCWPDNLIDLVGKIRDKFVSAGRSSTRGGGGKKDKRSASKVTSSMVRKIEEKKDTELLAGNYNLIVPHSCNISKGFELNCTSF